MQKKTIIAIGNFDGVHFGHRDMLRHARNIADRHNLELVILTFAPHPRQIFQPNIAPFRITPDLLKAQIFKNKIKPDHYDVLDFNHALQHLEANDFIQNFIIEKWNASYVIVGRDFHFGYGRKGTIETLGARDEFETIAADLFEIADVPVTSSRIREHLKAAEMKQANALLGWDWFIESEVVHGDKRGRELGYPTANMHFGDCIVPSHGVYAVKVQIEGERTWRHGAANIGIRPMFETAMPMCETYIFDFDAEIYGHNLKVMPVQKIRDEMKFDHLDDLIVQMGADCKVAKEILQKT